LKKELVSLLQGDGFKSMHQGLFDAGVRVISDPNRKPPDPDAGKEAGVMKSRSIVNTTQIYRDTIAHARELMAKSAAADRQLASDILDDTSGNGNWSYATTDAWLRAPAFAPAVFPKMSLPRVLALSMNATVQCAPLVNSTARMLYRARNVVMKDVPAFTPRYFCQQVSDKIKELRPQDIDSRSTKDKTKAGNVIDTDLILRYDPTSLDKAVQAARTLLVPPALLAPGSPPSGYLSAGCLSGYRWENPRNMGGLRGSHPFPEHYILIFAAFGDSMLFWDPDARVTQITEFGDSLGVNIGLLYYDHSDPARPTLSTGVDFADLTTLDSGDHKNHQRRHRYQVAWLTRL